MNTSSPFNFEQARETVKRLFMENEDQSWTPHDIKEELGFDLGFIDKILFDLTEVTIAIEKLPPLKKNRNDPYHRRYKAFKTAEDRMSVVVRKTGEAKEKLKSLLAQERSAIMTTEARKVLKKQIKETRLLIEKHKKLWK